MAHKIIYFEPFPEFQTDEFYAYVPSKLLRDPDISPKTKWFISYLLSFTGEWKISIPYIIKNQKISKNSIYPMVKEAIAAGYVKREIYLDKGRKCYRYFVSRNKAFK